MIIQITNFLLCVRSIILKKNCNHHYNDDSSYKFSLVCNRSRWHSDKAFAPGGDRFIRGDDHANLCLAWNKSVSAWHNSPFGHCFSLLRSYQ